MIWTAGLDSRTRWPVGAAARAGGALLVLLGALFGGLGWLYALRGLNWFAVGPHVPDSLPLLQLAGFDGQPLARVIAAWVPAGAVAGLAIARLPRLRRVALAAAFGGALLLLASQASFALARNLRFADVVWSRQPGFGPWLEGLMFGIGCALPRRVSGGGLERRARGGLALTPGSLLLSHPRLRGGEHRDAPEH